MLVLALHPPRQVDKVVAIGNDFAGPPSCNVRIVSALNWSRRCCAVVFMPDRYFTRGATLRANATSCAVR
jgi:hypothetical protein